MKDIPFYLNILIHTMMIVENAIIYNKYFIFSVVPSDITLSGPTEACDLGKYECRFTCKTDGCAFPSPKFTWRYVFVSNRIAIGGFLIVKTVVMHYQHVPVSLTLTFHFVLLRPTIQRYSFQRML